MEFLLIAGVLALVGISIGIRWLRLQVTTQHGRLEARFTQAALQVTTGSGPQRAATSLSPLLRKDHGDRISSSTDAPRLGFPAPEFELPDGADNVLGPSRFSGTTIFLLFWSPTCSHCKHIIDELRTWETNPDAARVQLLIVSTGPASLHADLKLKAPVLLDDQSRTRLAFGAPGTPSAVVIDEYGNIASTLARGGPSVLALLRRAPHIQPRTERPLSMSETVPV